MFDHAVLFKNVMLKIVPNIKNKDEKVVIAHKNKK